MTKCQRLFLLVNLVALFGGQVAVAQPVAQPKVPGKHQVLGEGSTSCGRYLEGRSKGEPSMQYTTPAWVRGYVSARNLADSRLDVVGLGDNAVVMAYIDKFCRENPLDVVAHAAVQLYAELLESGKARYQDAQRR